VAALPAPVLARAGWKSWIGAASALLLLIASGALVFLYRKKITRSRHWMTLSKRLRRKAAPPQAPAARVEPTEPD
jgi:CHASE2 domain-containing sensor protein